MIRVEKQESRVVLQLDMGSHTIPFTWETPHEFWASLLLDRINEVGRHRIQAALTEAYNEGWADAKAKRQKRADTAGQWWKIMRYKA